MTTLYHCADARNAAIAAQFQSAERHVRTKYSPWEIPPTQRFKTELVELVGDSSGIADCRRVLRQRAAMHPVWLANEVSNYAEMEDSEPPAILKWLPREQVARFHHLRADDTLSRPYGYTRKLVADVVEMLCADPETKRCVVTFQRPEYVSAAPETPCAVSTQYLLRGDRLWTVSAYRSHDLFAGNMMDPVRVSAVQQAVAAAIQAEPGPLVMQEGSLHYYPLRKHSGITGPNGMAEDGCRDAVSPGSEQAFDLFPLPRDKQRARESLFAFCAAFRDGPASELATGNVALDSMLVRARQWRRSRP